MNYRHAFHAGNFADVFKHIVLTRILAHLQRKETAFRVIDLHAGAGLYDLTSDEARRGGEWEGGIGAFRRAQFSAETEALLALFYEALAKHDHAGRRYPGSPLFVLNSLRAQDRAAFNELQPETARLLHRALPPRDPRLAFTALDAFTAWKAQIPPPERRGLVLVDPPFEKPNDFTRMGQALAMMARKWATGICACWYPIKDRRAVRAFEEAARASEFGKLLVLEFHVDDMELEGPLSACGMLIANPPYSLQGEMTKILPELASALARGNTARWAADWLTEA